MGQSRSKTDSSVKRETVEDTEHYLNELIWYCDMFRYAARVSKSAKIGTPRSEFLTFGLTHLTCALFITTDFHGEKAGVHFDASSGSSTSSN